MATENQAEVSSTTFFDLPLYDVIMPHITHDLKDKDLLAMWEAVAEFRAYRETIEEIIGAKRHLEISKYSPNKELFPIAVKTCRQLRSIEIDFFKLRKNWNKSLVMLLANNPLISEITIQNGTWKRFLKIFTNTQISLRRITIFDFDMENVENEGLSAFFNQQPFLRSITLGCLYEFSGSLRVIGRTCHELEEIDMTNCETDTFDGEDVMYIVQSCPRLRTFLLPESTICLLLDYAWVMADFTIAVNLLWDMNITFCDADEPILRELMEVRNQGIFWGLPI